MPVTDHPPIVLALSGHDPSGGAGIQADIESIGSQGCHPMSVITCLTVQDSHNVQRLQPVEDGLFIEQIDLILREITPDAIKIGLIGEPSVALAIASFLRELPETPVVLDPVLATGGGSNLAPQELIDVICRELLPRTTLLTPNRSEAERLAGQASLEENGTELLNLGCNAVLITGADEVQGKQVENRLFLGEDRQDFYWPKLPHQYHGSGCTLASACAAQLALGKALPEAVEEAQRYTWQTLNNAFQPGTGQHLPQRHTQP